MFPEWAKKEVVPFGYNPQLPPIRYSFDGSVGLFRCGDRVFDSLMIIPFAVRADWSRRNGMPADNWIDFAFLDGDLQVCVLSVRKNAANELLIFVADLEQSGVKMHALEVAVGAKAVEVQVIDELGFAEVDTYFVPSLPEIVACKPVCWELFMQIEQLIKIFEWNLLGEVSYEHDR